LKRLSVPRDHVHDDNAGSPALTGDGARLLADVASEPAERIALPTAELNRVLGGGIVPGSVVLVAGEPGIGKSTLLLQTSAAIARSAGPVLYASGEESAPQIRLRADRMAVADAPVHVLAESRLEPVIAEIERLRPRSVVVDSIQTARLDHVDSAPGSVTQVRECTAQLISCAKRTNVPVFLVGHVTKSGDIAGPRMLEHMVDVVLYMEGDRFHGTRLLRSVKNRFGSTREVGVFEMQPDGLAEVTNPSAAFLAERLAGVPGSAVTVTMEGSRPLLVEIQALVSRSGSQVPRRTADGIDLSRLLILIAVLSRRLGVRLLDHDVFVNVVGGLRVTEPAADLAVATAIASSAQGQPVASDLALFGEVGLSGELRSVAHADRRLAEAAALGFKRVIGPGGSLGKARAPKGVKATGARTLRGALEVALVGDGQHSE
jgi:DNA repair protein RadA/Sms